MRDDNREFIVGIVFLALMGALAAITLNLSGGLFKPSETQEFRFDRVAGLTEGSEVWINGVPSGNVKSVSIDADGRVRATAKLKNRLEDIDLGAGGRVEVKSKSALGGAVISIDTNDPTGSKDLKEMVGRVWPAMKDPFLSVGESVRDVGSEVKSLLDKVGQGEGTLARLINDKAMADDLSKTLENLRRVTDRLEAGEGSAGKLLRDDGLYAKLDAAAGKLDALLARMDRGEGTLGKLLTDETMAEDLAATVRDLRSVAGRLERGEGTIGKLLTDESVYRDIKAATADLGDITRQVKEGKGLLGRLLHDEELGEDTASTLRDVRDIVADAKAGRGTLGKLLSDDGLYNDARDALRSIQRSSEEARENAPILTFAGFLFKTF